MKQGTHLWTSIDVVDQRRNGPAAGGAVQAVLGTVTASARWVADRSGSPPPTSAEGAPSRPDPRYVVLGAASLIEGQLRGVSNRLGTVVRPPAALAARLVPTGVRRAVEARLRELDAQGRVEAESGAEDASRFASAIADELARNPVVINTVMEIVDQIMWPLLDDVLPKVIERLTNEPEQIRVLVQSQSHGMLEEVARSARSRAADGDEAAARFVSRFLRRRPAPATVALADVPVTEQPASIEP